MRSYTVAAAFAALAAANPLPQEIDWAAVDALAPIPTVTIPVVDVGAQASTVTYEPSAAATSVAAEVMASGVDSDASSGLKARGATACNPQPTGAGPVPTDDTPEAFLAYPEFSTKATTAPTPNGYYNTFEDLKASNNAYGYMGYTLLDSYGKFIEHDGKWDTVSKPLQTHTSVLQNAMLLMDVAPSTSTTSAVSHCYVSRQDLC